MIALHEIGYSKKPYGKDGFLRLNLKEEYLNSLKKARALFFDLDGSRVPFLVESVIDHANIIVKLDEIDNPQQASMLVNRTIYLEEKEIELSQDKKALLQDDAFKNFDLYDRDKQYCGKIIKTETYPFQIMAHVELDGKAHLIPLHEDWIIESDFAKKELYMDLPEGLF